MSLAGFFRRTTYWISDKIKGSPVRSQFDDIRFIMNNRIEGDKRIDQYLKNLLNHATVNTEFYKEYNGLPFVQFPVMNKFLYIENFDVIFVEKFINDHYCLV